MEGDKEGGRDIGKVYWREGMKKGEKEEYDAIQCTIYSIQGIIYRGKYMLYIVQCTLYTVQCTCYVHYTAWRYANNANV